jgi:hypothetical protein
MFKFLFLCSLFLTSSVVLASPMDQMLTIKERLRISLWIEGIEESAQPKSAPQPKRVLSEELERALRKM